LALEYKMVYRFFFYWHGEEMVSVWVMKMEWRQGKNKKEPLLK
jgi:hypothetical protein